MMVRFKFHCTSLMSAHGLIYGTGRHTSSITITLRCSVRIINAPAAVQRHLGEHEGGALLHRARRLLQRLLHSASARACARQVQAAHAQRGTAMSACACVCAMQTAHVQYSSIIYILHVCIYTVL
jgi:hypothetical protein